MTTIFDPEEIALKRFVIRWRGYDTREVDTFLRAVAADFRRLIDRVAEDDQSASTADRFVDVRGDLDNLLSRVDLAVARLEGAGPSDPFEQADSFERADSFAQADSLAQAASFEPGDCGERAALRLVQGGTGGA